MKFLFNLFFNFLIVLFALSQITFAQESVIQLGEEIFSQNCVACHANGENVLVQEKTLKIEALEKFGKNTVEAIVTQVINGNSAGMPAFGERLSDDEIVGVASYVLSQAKQQAW